MQLDEAINRMLTCATAERCAREEACFEVVHWAKQRRVEEARREALLRAVERQERQDEIRYFTPLNWPVKVEQWEMARTDDPAPVWMPSTPSPSPDTAPAAFWLADVDAWNPDTELDDGK